MSAGTESPPVGARLSSIKGASEFADVGQKLPLGGPWGGVGAGATHTGRGHFPVGRGARRARGQPGRGGGARSERSVRACGRLVGWGRRARLATTLVRGRVGRRRPVDERVANVAGG